MDAGEDRATDLRLIRRASTGCTIVIVAVLAAGMLANSMTKEVSRDEHMYCTAGVLLARGELIYRDFAYPAQLPYHPLLLGVLYELLGTQHYLLAGRLVSVFCDVAVIVLILAIYRRVFGQHRRAGQWLGLSAAVLYAFNPVVTYAAGYAWNHDVVILCVVLSLWLFIHTGFRRVPRFWRLASMGALLMAASCMRVTTVLIPTLFLAVILIAARGSLHNRIRTALPFILASLLVASWPLWIFAQAPRAMWLDLVRIPALYAEWLRQIGGVYSKVLLTLDCLTRPGYLLLLVLAGSLAVVLIRRRSSLSRITRRNLLMAVATAVLLGLIAFLPPTMWPQYWAVPVPFVAIVCAYPLAVLRQAAEKPEGKRAFRIACWVVFVCAFGAVLANPGFLTRMPAVLVPERWAPVELHRVAVDLGEKTKKPQRVATLGPLYALEGGCDIYRELASGSIIYRAADVMLPEERKVTHTVGPKTIDALLRRQPPSAVVVGVEPSYFTFLEEPLLQAVEPTWPRDVYDDALRAYFRP